MDYINDFQKVDFALDQHEDYVKPTGEFFPSQKETRSAGHICASSDGAVRHASVPAGAERHFRYHNRCFLVLLLGDTSQDN